MQQDRKKVVLVDGDPNNLKLERNTLAGKYDVFAVPGAEKLFQLLEKILPDIILLDIQIPGINGYEVIKILKKNPRTADIPVIFLAPKADPSSEIEGFNLGAVDYVSRPFSPQLLLKRVDLHILVESQRKELLVINENVQEMVEEKNGAMVELQNAMLTTMSNLVESRDELIGDHVERIVYYISLLVEEMLQQGVYTDVIETWDITTFLHAAQLHDVGKISIRDSILLKPAPLTFEEFEVMKKHTTFGEMVIEHIEQSSHECEFLTHAKILAGSHHEKWDGTGYPRGLAGDDIPLQGRMMALIDVYDALVTDKPYKKAFPPDRVVQIVAAAAGVQFDPALIGVFSAAQKRFHL